MSMAVNAHDGNALTKNVKTRMWFRVVNIVTVLVSTPNMQRLDSKRQQVVYVLAR